MHAIELHHLWDRLSASQPIADVLASPLGWFVWHRLRPDPAARVVVARKQGVPVGLVALTRAGLPSWKRLYARRYVCAGDLHWHCRYPITGRDVLGDMRALLDQVAREGGWDELVLGPVLADSPTRRALEAAGHALGMCPLVSDFGHAPRILVHGTWQEYYKSRSAKLRADVASGEKRLGKLGAVRLEEVRRGSALDDALAHFFRVEATGWKLREGSAIACDPKLQECYVALAHAAAAHGRFRSYLLRAGDQVVAANYCLEHAGELFQLKTGYDAAHSKASPGQVLHKRVLERLFQTGDCTAFDFMTGGGEHGGYKERWANDLRAYVEVQLFRPRRPRGQVLARMVRLKRAMAARDAAKV